MCVCVLGCVCIRVCVCVCYYWHPACSMITGFHPGGVSTPPHYLLLIQKLNPNLTLKLTIRVLSIVVSVTPYLGEALVIPRSLQLVSISKTYLGFNLSDHKVVSPWMKVWLRFV